MTLNQSMNEINLQCINGEGVVKARTVIINKTERANKNKYKERDNEFYVKIIKYVKLTLVIIIQ